MQYNRNRNFNWHFMVTFKKFNCVFTFALKHTLLSCSVLCKSHSSMFMEGFPKIQKKYRLLKVKANWGHIVNLHASFYIFFAIVGTNIYVPRCKRCFYKRYRMPMFFITTLFADFGASKVRLLIRIVWRVLNTNILRILEVCYVKWEIESALLKIGLDCWVVFE